MSGLHPHLLLAEELGPIDIHLLDLIHKGRLVGRSRVLDAGCGSGRNLVYLLRTGYEVRGVDPDPDRLGHARAIAAELRPDLPPENFVEATIEECGLEEEWADLVISNAVLHFADDAAHFGRMLSATWSHVRPGGLLFCRLATTIGIEEGVIPRGGGRYLLPDASERFLVDLPALLDWTERLGGALVEPIKSTSVQGLRVMTTWVMERTLGPRP